MSITPTIDNGFYVTHVRCGIRMSRRCRTLSQAEETLRTMKEDIVVDLPRKRFLFNPDKIFIIHKPSITNKKYKAPYSPENS
jgi:hypothetical protein